MKKSKYTSSNVKKYDANKIATSNRMWQKSKHEIATKIISER